MNELKDDLKEFAKADFAALSAQVQALQKDVSALADALRQAGIGRVESVGESMRNAFGQAASGLQGSADDARQAGEDAAANLEAMINRSPLTSMLIALGLGFMAGRFTKR